MTLRRYYHELLCKVFGSGDAYMMYFLDPTWQDGTVEELEWKWEEYEFWVERYLWGDSRRGMTYFYGRSYLWGKVTDELERARIDTNK